MSLYWDLQERFEAGDASEDAFHVAFGGAILFLRLGVRWMPIRSWRR